MKRTKAPAGKSNLLQTYSELTNRANLAASMGQSYDGRRDLYNILGYKKVLRYQDFLAQFVRQDIARAIIERPVKVTWSGPCSIIESNKEDTTTLEKDWLDLERRLNLKSKFIRLDKLTGLGRYGVLYMGFNDIRKQGDTEKPVSKSVELLFLRPLGESSAKIATWEKNTTNPRYGLPLLYDITLVDSDGSTESQIKVHYTRVLHVVENAMESEIEGSPRLEVVYNRLQDLEKLVGGSAEMFWRGARPGYSGEIDKEFTMSPVEEKALEDQMDEYENDLRRLLINKGLKVSPLAIQISDPKNHVDVQIQLISAVTGIPKRILSGSERGELSSSQDSVEWVSYVQSRREEFAEPHIIRPFVDRMIEIGILPKPQNGYDIEWQDLFAISEKDKVEIGKSRASALKDYFTNPMASEVVPPKAFYEFFLGFGREQINLISDMEGDDLIRSIKEENALADAEIQKQVLAINPPPKPVIAPSTPPKLKIIPSKTGTK